MKTCVGPFCEAKFSSIRTIMGENNIELSLFTTRSSRNNTKMYAFVIGETLIHYIVLSYNVAIYFYRT